MSRYTTVEMTLHYGGATLVNQSINQSINYFIVRLKVDQLPTKSAALRNN